MLPGNGTCAEGTEERVYAAPESMKQLCADRSSVLDHQCAAVKWKSQSAKSPRVILPCFEGTSKPAARRSSHVGLSVGLTLAITCTLNRFSAPACRIAAATVL